MELTVRVSTIDDVTGENIGSCNVTATIEIIATDSDGVETVIDVTDEMMVQIKWLGNCEMCNMSAMTMRAGIEETLKNKVPEVVGVEAMNGVGV